jgi:hypothetical protein
MDEFLYRWPGGRHLMTLIELEKRMDDIISKKVRKDFENMDNIMVDVFDARVLRNGLNETGNLGKMSVSTVVQKFH